MNYLRVIIAYKCYSKRSYTFGRYECKLFETKRNKEFKSTFYLNGFTQLITKPTRKTEDSQTLIDIIVTKSAENISHVDVIAKSLNDHGMVVCVRKMNYKRFLPKTIRCRDYKTNNSESMNIDFDWQPVLNETDINTPFNLFDKILTEILNRHAKIIEKKVKGGKRSWIGDNVKKLMNERDQVLRKGKKLNQKMIGQAIRLLEINVTTI